jgi:hypothetical protein
VRKRKSAIIPVGDFDKVRAADEDHVRTKEARITTWCKICGRKHGKRKECQVLRLEEDLTRSPTKENKDGELILNRKIARYTTKPESEKETI